MSNKPLRTHIDHIREASQRGGIKPELAERRGETWLSSTAQTEVVLVRSDRD